MILRASRALVIGDVMTDVVVRPEGPVVRASDRRASITVQPGGSAANQAAWLAWCGAGVDFVARVGAADVESETARFMEIGVTPYLVGDPESRDRAGDCADRPGWRTQFSHRSRRQRRARSQRHPRRPDRQRLSHQPLRLFIFFSLHARGGSRRHAAREDKPISVDPASAAFLREVGADNFLAWTQGATILFPNEEEAAVLADSTDPEIQGDRLAKHYPIVVIKRGAGGAEALEGGRRWLIKEAGNKPIDISGVRDPGVAALLAQSERRFPVNKRRKLEVVDTTGAGDAFAAGFLAARLTGADIRSRLGAPRRRARAARQSSADSQGGRRLIAADRCHHFF